MSVETYMKSISEFQMISPKEEIILSRLIQSPETSEEDRSIAINKLVESNLRIVIHIVRSMYPKSTRNFDFMDLVAVGNKRLMDLASRYNYDKHKSKFGTFVYLPLRQEISKEINQRKSFLSTPEHYSIIKHKIDMLRNLIPDITDKEIAEKLGISIITFERVELSQNIYITRDDVTYANIADESGNAFDETISKEFADYLHKIINEELTPTKKEVVTAMLLNNEGPTKVGKRYGVSKQAAHQMLKNSLATLRKRMLHDNKDFDGLEKRFSSYKAEFDGRGHRRRLITKQMANRKICQIN